MLSFNNSCRIISTLPRNLNHPIIAGIMDKSSLVSITARRVLEVLLAEMFWLILKILLTIWRLYMTGRILKVPIFTALNKIPLDKMILALLVRRLFFMVINYLLLKMPILETKTSPILVAYLQQVGKENKIIFLPSKSSRNKTFIYKRWGKINLK